MTMDEASMLVEGKECPKCHAKLSAKNVGWTGDRIGGWHLEHNGEPIFPMTALIYCPNRLLAKPQCDWVGGMGEVGVERPKETFPAGHFQQEYLM